MSTAGLFASVFGVIFVAELPDKTALATLVLATRQKAVVVFAGSAAALALQSVIAVALGGLLSALPRTPIALVTGMVFLVSAVLMWRKQEDAIEDADGPKAGPSSSSDFRAFLSTIAVVFAAEWGDLTQVGTAALAARYGRPVIVLAGATLALWTVAAIAVFIGHRARRWLNPRSTRKVAAVLFGVVGAAILAGSLF
jgi:Ca2+/H+ antiporter, TMEM165/GDT1 family